MSLGISLSLALASRGAAEPVVDLTTLAFNGLWTGSYVGIAYAGTASAGTSSAKTLSILTAYPTVGTAVNSKAPMVFNGTTQGLTDGVNVFSTYITTTAYRILLLLKSSSAAAPSGLPYNDPGLMTESGGNFGVNFTSNGVGVYHSSTLIATKACAADGNWHLVDISFDGANVSIVVDDGTAATGASAGTGAVGGALRLGSNYGNTVRFTGSMLMVGTAPTTLLSGLTRAQAKAAINSIYALSL
jgi:hypothetical protein